MEVYFKSFNFLMLTRRAQSIGSDYTVHIWPKLMLYPPIYHVLVGVFLFQNKHYPDDINIIFSDRWLIKERWGRLRSSTLIIFFLLICTYYMKESTLKRTSEYCSSLKLNKHNYVRGYTTEIKLIWHDDNVYPKRKKVYSIKHFFIL